MKRFAQVSGQVKAGSESLGQSRASLANQIQGLSGNIPKSWKTDSEKSLFLCSNVAMNEAKRSQRSKHFFEGKG